MWLLIGLDLLIIFFDQFLSILSSNWGSCICFERVLFIMLTSTLTLYLLSQMNFITTKRDVDSLSVFVFIVPLAIKRLANTWLLTFFLLLKVHFSVNKAFKKTVGMLGLLVLLVNLSKIVGRSEKISLKISTSIAWLLFKANLLIFRDWFLLRVFLHALSSFSAFFFLH